MRWPWQKAKPIDPELQQRIDHIQSRTSQQLDKSRSIAGKSHELREFASDVRKRNHFAEGYLPPSPRRFRIPWKHSSQS